MSLLMDQASKPPRWLVVAALFPLYAALLGVVGLHLFYVIVEPMRALRDPLGALRDMFRGDTELAVSFGVIGAAVAFLQGLMLLPLLSKRVPTPGVRPKSLYATFVVAGVLAAFISSGIFVGLADLVAVIAFDSTIEDLDHGEAHLAGVAIVLLGWIPWTLLIAAYTRNLWADRVVGRAVKVLFAATGVEFILLIPIDVMVRRRTDCYCATGTFWGLVAAAVSVMVLAGPGLLLTTMGRRHRAWRRTHCARCAYPQGPAPGPRCPECGHDWAASSAAK